MVLLNLAIINSGFESLVAAFLLKRQGHDVSLIEKTGSLTSTYQSTLVGNVDIDIDQQVFNKSTQPNLSGLLETLGVESQNYANNYSIDSDSVQWSTKEGGVLQSLLQLNIQKLSMQQEISKFYQTVQQALSYKETDQEVPITFEEFLQQKKFSYHIQVNFIYPILAYIYGYQYLKVLNLDSKIVLLQLMRYNLFDISTFKQESGTKVVKQGKKQLAQLIIKELSKSQKKVIYLNHEITSIKNASKPLNGGTNGHAQQQPQVEVSFQNGSSKVFDKVILNPQHSALKSTDDSLLPQNLKSLVAGLKTVPAKTVLHSDTSFMPKNAQNWNAYNFVSHLSIVENMEKKSQYNETGDMLRGPQSGATDEYKHAICCTVWINKIYELSTNKNYFITYNSYLRPKQSEVLRWFNGEKASMEAENLQKLDKALGNNMPQNQIILMANLSGSNMTEDILQTAVDVVKIVDPALQLPWMQGISEPNGSTIDILLFQVFDQFLDKFLQEGQVTLILPNGQTRVYGTQNTLKKNLQLYQDLKVTLKVLRWRFFIRILQKYDTGLGEAYMDKDFEVDDIGLLLAVLVQNSINMKRSRQNQGLFYQLLNTLGESSLLSFQKLQGNTMWGSQQNISYHYDAGNEMYRLFMDETLTYSCALHKPEISLMEAQIAKYDRLIGLAEIRDGDHILDLGFGWGGLSIRAALTKNVTVKGVTLSKEQLRDTQEKIKKIGIADRIDLVIQDYRDIPEYEQFDAVISVEMIEHIGYDNYPIYFGKISHMLKTGRKAVIQAITIPDDRFDGYVNSTDFIRQHIFPGGSLPSLKAIKAAMANTGLVLEDLLEIGKNYVQTLNEWRINWVQNYPLVRKSGYPDYFFRKYMFYFACSEAVFDSQHVLDYQIMFTKRHPTPQSVVDMLRKDRAKQFQQLQVLKQQMESVSRIFTSPLRSVQLQNTTSSRVGGVDAWKLLVPLLTVFIPFSWVVLGIYVVVCKVMEYRRTSQNRQLERQRS